VSTASPSDFFSSIVAVTRDDETYWLVLIEEWLIKHPRQNVFVGDWDGLLSKERHFDDKAV